ncbi:MAG TPA: class I SAM-dependent methyltransferase [Acidimicrobiia bacterium]
MTDYARIGVGYATHRIADPRIEAQLHAALGDARTVLNVGAGTGNYEPRDRAVFAVEPSPTMLAQRAPHSAPAVRGRAEALPFADGAFDAAFGILTVHHWTDRARGLAEMARVARRVVVLFFEAEMADVLWMYDYWPEIRELHSEHDPPNEAFFRAQLDVESVGIVPVPADCTDHFGGSYWCRPEKYLDRRLTAGMSSFAQLDEPTFERGAARLRADLESGRWDERLAHLRALDEIDLGYRIVSGRRSPSK